VPRTSGGSAQPATAAQIESTFTAAGQIYAGEGAGTGELLAVGSAGQRLTVGGADPSGLEWSNPTNDALQYNDLLGWTFDPIAAYTTASPYGAAQVWLSRIRLPTAMTVTNVLIDLTVFGVTLTNSYLALFKSDGTVIGQSADQSTRWMAGGTLGLYPYALVGGPYVCTPLAANDFLWPAVYCGTAGTLPTFLGGLGTLVNAGVTAPRSRCGVIGQANTATLVSISPAGVSSQTQSFWMALS
jgi:hypothetical protein